MIVVLAFMTTFPKLTPSLPATCPIKLHNGIRVSGFDIGPKRNASSADECCALCTAESECKVFFWAPPSVCWLKTRAQGKAVPCKGCVVGAASIAPSPSPPGPGCSTRADCSGSACDTARHQCVCDAAWTGEHCAHIKFGKAYACGKGGLCLNHSAANAAKGGQAYSDFFTSTWGGEAVKGDDGRYHMYAAGFGKDEALASWLSNSRVLHAESSTPFGPYELKDVALGPLNGSWDGLTQHNPAVQRDPISGTYLLYYMGSTNNGTVHTGGGRCSSHPEKQSLCNQRVGLATSLSPSGPWSRASHPIVDAGPAGEWDDQFTCNPTPLVLRNGSVLLLYKGRSREDFNVMSTGVAFAKHWSGPYVRAGTRSISGIPGSCEDAGIYQDPKSEVLRIVLHCGCNYLSLWSTDGMDWTPTKQGSLPWCNVTWSEGTQGGKLTTRQRPKWLRAANGSVVALITGAASKSMHGGDTFTMVQEVMQ